MNIAKPASGLVKSLKLAGLATTALYAAPTVAQTDESASDFLEQIFVTARRGSELLSDIPVTVDVFGSQDIDKLNLDTVQDIVRFTPGLNLTQGARPDSTRIAIRGLQADVGRSSVALRINDIDVTAEAVNAAGLGYFPNARLLDLERVEVVKGAQVALYGRSAFGGALNFVSRRPDLEEWNGGANVQVTSEREYEANARVNGPLVEGKVGLGLVAAYWHDGGSYRNQLNNERIGGTDGHGIAASFNLKPTDRFSGFVRAEYSSDEPETRPGVTTSPNTTVTFPDDVAAVIGSPSSLVFTGVVPNVGEDGVVTALDPITGNAHPGLDRETFSISGDFEYAFDQVSIRSLTGYYDIDTVTFQSTPFQAHPWINADGSLNGAGTGEITFNFVPQSLFLNASTEIFSQDFQIFSNDDHARFRWLVGGLYWEERIDQGQDQPTVIPLGNISTADVRSFFADQLFDETRRFSRTTKHLSGYIWAEFDATDKLAISVEGRYANEDLTYITQNTVNISLGIPIAPGVPPIFSQVSAVPDPQEPGLVDDSYFVPKAVITYRHNDDLTLYASVAKSVKPAGHATGAADTFSQFTLFEAEELWSYELGLKSSWLDNTVTLNAAIYYLDYTNQQVESTVFDAAAGVPRAATENAGDSRLFGTDIDLTVRPMDGLTIRAAYTYTNTKYQDYEFFSSAAGTASRGPCVRFETLGSGEAGIQGCIISYDGNRNGQTPLHQAQFFINYTAPVSDTLDFFIEPNIRYTGDRFLDASNLGIAPSFLRVDLRAGIQSENWQIIAFVENLTDGKTPEDIIQFLDYQLPDFPPAAVSFLPDPITFGVNATFNF